MPVRRFDHTLTTPEPPMSMDTIVFADAAKCVTMKLYQQADMEDPNYPDDKFLEETPWEDWVNNDEKYWIKPKIYAPKNEEPVALKEEQKAWVSKVVAKVKLRAEAEPDWNEPYTTISSVYSVPSPGGTTSEYKVEFHPQITQNQDLSHEDSTDYSK